MADSLEKQLNDFANGLDKLLPSTAQKQMAVEAGAEVLRNAIASTAKRKHYSKHNDEVYGHMADNVIIQRSNSEGIKNGTAIVGWKNYRHAANAMYTNDGTVKIAGDHWLEVVREENKEAVFAVQKEILRKAMKS